MKSAMDLPKNFNHSQKSLQDFLYCRRLFKYRYIERIKWPAVELHPINELEKRAQLGAEFHRIVHQFYSGVSEEKIEDYLGERIIKKWWTNFKNSIVKNLDEADIYLPEVRLYSYIGDSRLIAKIDLISIKPDGNRIIYDWKTSQKRPKREFLLSQFQSLVYPFLVISVDDRIYPWKKVDPDMVRMIYWFAEYPENIEIFKFDEKKFNESKEVITDTIEKIENMNYGDFIKTDQEVKCKFCIYRSLCGRKGYPGDVAEATDWILPEERNHYEMDLNQIEEIEY